MLVTRYSSCQLPTGPAAIEGLGEDGPGDPLLPSTTGSRAAALCLPAALLAVHWGQGLEGDRGEIRLITRLSSLMVHFLNGPLPQFLNGPLSGQVRFWYTCSAHYTCRSQLQNGQTKMKNECRFEIFILKGVVLGRYIF